MAQAGEIVEKAVHDGLRRIVQGLWDEHHICVQDVWIKWIDISEAGKPAMVVSTVEVRSLTKSS